MDSLTRRWDALSGAGRSCALGLGVWLSAAPASAQVARYAWTNEEAHDECQLSTSPVAGKPYVAARVTCLFSANIEVIGAVLRDIEHYPDWMEDCSQTKLLKVADRGREVYFFWYRQHIPLFTDRDLVLRTELTVNQEAYRVIDIELSREVPYDAGQGYVRMPSFRAQCALEKLDEERTRVTYLIDPDLGPGLPVGIANLTIAKTPLKSLRRMMKMVRLQKYLEAAKPRSAAAL